MIDLFDEMKAYAELHELPILRDEELPLFHRIITGAQPHRVLEIGTAIAYSTLQMASVLPADATITTIEADAERADVAREFISRSGVAQRIQVITGDATALVGSLAGPWDFVFLDGPKGQYSRQLKKLLPHLAPVATVLADNILYHGMIHIKGTIPHKHRTAVVRLREYLKMVTEDPRFSTEFFEKGDGMTVSRWKG